MVDTTTETSFAEQYAEAYVVEAARQRGEPDWLVERRAEAARAFEATPMPTPKLRPWKYTDVTGLAIESFAPSTAAPAISGVAPAGGFAGTIADALAVTEHAERVQQHLGSLVPATEGKFSAVNAALWRDGVYVYVPRGKAFDEPVVVEVDAGALDPNAAIFPRILVVAEAQGEVSVVVRNQSGEAPLLAPGVVEVVAEADSSVRILLDAGWGLATQEFTTVRSRLDRSAQVQVATLAIGGSIVKQALEAMIDGEGADSRIRGVALGDGNQHFDFVTLQDHAGAHSTSDVEIKAALAGASKSIYYGVTRVEETASGAEANQENRNMLLSRHAKADSDPVLEILTSEVIRCGHGATVGPVDQEALFYLQSRGLDRRQAMQLLVAGFFSSVIGDIPVEGLSEELQEDVVRKLANADLAPRPPAAPAPRT